MGFIHVTEGEGGGDIKSLVANDETEFKILTYRAY